MFVYSSKKEFELKFSFEARCRALEAAAASQITDVNMMFCIQGIVTSRIVILVKIVRLKILVHNNKGCSIYLKMTRAYRSLAYSV